MPLSMACWFIEKNDWWNLVPLDDVVSAGVCGARGAVVPLIVDAGNREGNSSEDSSCG